MYDLSRYQNVSLYLTAWSVPAIEYFFATILKSQEKDLPDRISHLRVLYTGCFDSHGYCIFCKIVAE
jgi:hypothetical protein